MTSSSPTASNSPLNFPKPSLQQKQYPLPEPVIHRIVDFQLLDPEAVKVKQDGGKQWLQPMLNLSMVNRATRQYAWKQRLERLNLALCFVLPKGEESVMVGSVDAKLARMENMIEEEWKYIANGICNGVKVITYDTDTPRAFRRLRLQYFDEAHSNPCFDTIIVKLWKIISDCPNVTEVDGVPTTPGFFYSAFTFPNLTHLTHENPFYVSPGYKHIRDTFPALRSICLRGTWDGVSDHYANKNKVHVSGLDFVMIETMVPEDDEFGVGSFEGCPLVSETGTDLVLSFQEAALFKMRMDLNQQNIRSFAKHFSALKPKVITLDLSVKHHREFGFDQTCTDAGGSAQPFRLRSGTAETRRMKARQFAEAFPTCQTFRIRMRATDTSPRECFFRIGPVIASEECNQALKERSMKYFVDFQAEIQRDAEGEIASIEYGGGKEDTELIKTMDMQIEMDKFKDYYRRLDSDDGPGSVAGSGGSGGSGGSEAGSSHNGHLSGVDDDVDMEWEEDFFGEEGDFIEPAQAAFQALMAMGPPPPHILAELNAMAGMEEEGRLSD